MDLEKMYEGWKAALLTPEKVLAAAKRKASLEGGAKELAIGFAIAGVISGIVTTIYTFGLGVGAIIMAPIGMVIGGLVASLIFNAIVYVVAKVLNGKGSFGTQFHLSALVMVPVAIVNAALGIIPVLGGLLGFLVSLFGIWLDILAVKEAHGFSTARAAAAVLVPIVVLLVIAMIFVAMFIALAGVLGIAGLAGLAAWGQMGK